MGKTAWSTAGKSKYNCWCFLFILFCIIQIPLIKRVYSCQSVEAWLCFLTRGREQAELTLKLLFSWTKLTAASFTPVGSWSQATRRLRYFWPTNLAEPKIFYQNSPMKSIGYASKLSENELSLGRLKFRLLESHVLCWNTQKYYVSSEPAKAAYVIKKNVSETNRVWGDI